VREFSADFNDIKGPRSEVWRECVGAGRANEGLRADWQRQLKLVQDEIGFRQIRFHGLLHDDMGVYSEAKDGKVSNQEVFRKIQPATAAAKVQIKLTHLPKGNYHAQFFCVGFEKNDAYTAYLKLGAPRQLTRDQVSRLKASASGAPEMENDVEVDESGNRETSLAIRANDMWLVKMSRK
jgi:xylan 1,4-beta-xylosidase